MDIQGQGQAPSVIKIDENTLFEHPTLGQISGKQLKDGVLMHSDYTKKTQSLADERKALEAQRDQISQYAGVVQTVDNLMLQDADFANKFAAALQNGGRLPETKPAPEQKPPAATTPAPQGKPTMDPQNAQLRILNQRLAQVQDTQAQYEVERAVEQLSAETGMTVAEINEKVLPEASKWVNTQIAVLDNLRFVFRAINHERVLEGRAADNGQRVLEKMDQMGFTPNARPNSAPNSAQEEYLKSIFSRGNTGSLFPQKK